MTGDGILRNPDAIRSLYGEIPELRDVRIRSVNLNWRGPTVTLRIDLPYFPERAPQDWLDADVDTVQCQLQFLAAEDISLTEWTPPATADVEMTPHGENRRTRVRVIGGEVTLTFDCSDSVLAGHVSAFRIQADGSDGGRHLFLSKIDARRHTALPTTDEKTFYERV